MVGAVMAQIKTHQPHANIWMDASAGSGKTYRLVERFTALLFADVPADKILCLTYTNAAAAEMRHRIISNLTEITHLDDAKLREKIAAYHDCAPADLSDKKCDDARNLLLHLLDAPEGLAIQTIHAYCQSILARFPLEARMFPGTKIISENQKQIITDEALDFLLDRGGQNSQLYELLKGMMPYKDFWELRDLLTNLLKIQYWHKGQYPKQAVDFADSLREYFGLDRAITQPMLQETYQAIFSKYENQWRDAEQALSQSGKSSDAKWAIKINAYLEGNDLSALESYFFIASGELRAKFCTNTIPSYVQSFLTQMATEYDEFYQQQKYIAIADASAMLLHLLIAYQGIYHQLKNHYGVVEYDDLIVKMTSLLGGDYASWVLYKCDGGFSHILLDEAQDTNLLQWEIIKNLTEQLFEKGSLFVVGDKKQSIYSFQGADVIAFQDSYSYFKQATENLGHEGAKLETEILQINRRSCAEIMDFVNQVFTPQPKILGLQDEFPTHSAYRAEQTDKGYVELWPLITYEKGKKDQASREYAKLIAKRIKDLLASDTILPTTGKKVQPGDIMILLRKRDSLSAFIANSLREAQVPVTGLDKYALSAHIVYQDMMALLEFINLPQNDLNFATLLKTPFINFSEEELFDLAHKREKPHLYDELQHRASSDARWQKIIEWLKQILARGDMLSPADFLHYIYHLRLPCEPKITLMQKYHARMADEALDILEQLLNLAHQYAGEETVSFYGFTHWLYENKAEIKRDFAQINQVKLQTIHGAKGLEAPIVFVPYLGKTHHTDRETIYGADVIKNQNNLENAYPLWVPYASMRTALFNQSKETQKNMQKQEEARLLYVALTRARDQLYLMGVQQNVKDETKDESWYQWIDTGIAEAIKPQTKKFDDGDILTHGAAMQDKIYFWGDSKGAMRDDVDATDSRQQEISFLPEWANKAVPEIEDNKLVFAPSHITKKSSDNVADNVELASHNRVMQYAALRGSLIHKLLEKISLMQNKSNLTNDATITVITKFLMDGGLEEKQAKDDCQQIITLVMKYPEFFQAGQNMRSEVPIVGQARYEDETRAFYGVIDRLIIGENELLILDYKTGKRTDKKLQNYTEIMNIYVELLTPCYPEKKINTALLWVDELIFDKLIIG